MELQFYFYIAYFFIAVFVLYFFRTFNWSMLKILWQNAKLDVASKEARIRAIAKGQKPFYFENGKVVVYAKSQLGAMLQYKKTKLRKTVSSHRTLKKV